jgi:Tol biopolymer transport system component
MALTQPEFWAKGPSWSPDGTRLVITAFDAQADRQFVSVIGTDGSDPVPLFSNAASNPSWSPDGRYIAFQCVPQDLTASGVAICLGSVDGSEVHELTAPGEGAWDSMAAWSPDSSTVIFRRISGGVATIGQIQADGTGLMGFDLPHGVMGSPGNWVY